MKRGYMLVFLKDFDISRHIQLRRVIFIFVIGPEFHVWTYIASRYTYSKFYVLIFQSSKFYPYTKFLCMWGKACCTLKILSVRGHRYKSKGKLFQVWKVIWALIQEAQHTLQHVVKSSSKHGRTIVSYITGDWNILQNCNSYGRKNGKKPYFWRIYRMN